MKSSVLKEIVRVALFMVCAIWGGMLFAVLLIAMAYDAGTVGMLKPMLVWIAAALLIVGDVYIMWRIWEWK